MSAPQRKDYPALWKAQAEKLDAQGHFSEYPAKRREEVLRKGYLGKLNPEAALQLASSKLEQGFARYTRKVTDDLRDNFGVVSTESRRGFLLERIREAQPDDYEPPYRLDEPPGYPYIYESSRLVRPVYLKFHIQVLGQRSQVAFISCHPPREQRKVR